MRQTRTLFFIPIIAAIILLLILQSTRPSEISPFGLLIVFILIYIISTGIATAMIAVGSRIVAGFADVLLRAQVRHISLRAAYLYGSVIAIAPVVVIAMLSVGSLGFGGILLLIVLEALAVFYVSRRI